MADWRSIEDALRAWALGASDLADDRVRWADQYGTRPGTGTFVSLKRDDMRAIAAVDELFDDADLSRPAGQEVRLQVRGLREFSLSANVWQTPVTDASATPTTAHAIASRLQTALRLPSVRNAFAAIGISCVDVGVVRNLSALLDTVIEGRAQFDARFYVVETASESVGYIAKADVAPIYGDDSDALDVMLEAPL